MRMAARRFTTGKVHPLTQEVLDDRRHGEEAQVSATAVTESAIRNRLDRAMERLAAEVRQRVPSLRHSIQHGRNASFPWWTVARLVNGSDESKIIDVSVDCQGTAEAWTIRADVAREDGSVLQEVAVNRQGESANGETLAEAVEAALQQVEDFLSRQGPLISSELA